MTCVAHSTIFGRPWGASALAECLDYAAQFEGVWQTTGREVAEYYLAQLPALAAPEVVAGMMKRQDHAPSRPGGRDTIGLASTRQHKWPVSLLKCFRWKTYIQRIDVRAPTLRGRRSHRAKMTS